MFLGIVGAIENKFKNKKSAVYGFGYGVLATLACVFGIIPVLGQILYYYAFKSLNDELPITFWLGFLLCVLVSIGIITNVWIIWYSHGIKNL